jgi:hypothetical protein
MEKLREREDSSSHGLCPLGTAKKFVFGYFLGAIKWWSLLEKKKNSADGGLGQTRSKRQGFSGRYYRNRFTQKQHIKTSSWLFFFRSVGDRLELQIFFCPEFNPLF